MDIIGASYLYEGRKDGDIKRDFAIVFDEKIVDVLPFEEAKKRYIADRIEFFKDSLLMPSLTNPHVHLEFGANRCALNYGEFTLWLGSVIANSNSTPYPKEEIEKDIDSMIKGGVSSFGAISSYGWDLEACVNSPAKIVYFNEIIGSNPALSDSFFEELMGRYEKSKEFRSDRFIPALSPHSPYSTHPKLVEKVIDVAKKEGVILSTHFLESKGEKEWLNSNKGVMKRFFKDFFKQERDSFISSCDYIELFRNTNTLFIHTLYADSKELELIKDIGGKVVSCPRSNRLLNSAKLNLNLLKKIGIEPLFATDGMSSNIDVSLLNELRYLLFIQYDSDINSLAKEALFSATFGAAKALGFNSGCLDKGYDADFLVCSLPIDFVDSSNQHLDIILHSKVQKVYINGRIYGDSQKGFCTL